MRPPGAGLFYPTLEKASGTLEQSERAQEKCILLPLFHTLTREEQELIASNLLTAIRAQREQGEKAGRALDALPAL